MRKLSDHINRFRIHNGPLGSDDTLGMTGSFYIPLKTGARAFVISSEGMEQYPWEHVSVSILKQKRCPTWEEMCFLKDLFWEEEEAVLQIHPPKSEYVNNHEYCLHLWKPKKEIELPPSIMVGLKK